MISVPTTLPLPLAVKDPWKALSPKASSFKVSRDELLVLQAWVWMKESQLWHVTRFDFDSFPSPRKHHSSSKSPDLIRVRPDQNLCSIHLCLDPRGISIWFGSHQGFEDDARSLVMDPWMKDPQNATRVFHHPWSRLFLQLLDVTGCHILAVCWKLVGWFDFSLKFLFDDVLFCFEWKEKILIETVKRQCETQRPFVSESTNILALFRRNFPMILSQDHKSPNLDSRSSPFKNINFRDSCLLEAFLVNVSYTFWLEAYGLQLRNRFLINSDITTSHIGVLG